MKSEEKNIAAIILTYFEEKKMNIKHAKPIVPDLTKKIMFKRAEQKRIINVRRKNA